jgi:hypothetical protein
VTTKRPITSILSNDEAKPENKNSKRQEAFRPIPPEGLGALQIRTAWEVALGKLEQRGEENSLRDAGWDA